MPRAVYPFFSFLCLLAVSGRAEDIRFVSESVQMAVPFRITLYAKDEATGKAAVDAALARVEALARRRDAI